MKFLSYLLFFTNILLCQERLNLDDNNFLTGIDFNNRVYLVLEKNNYYSREFNNNYWKKSSLHYSQLPKTKDLPYNFFHVNNKNYLVHKGCGTVYEFRNDSIIRIDNSFEHKNQFMASSFIYNNEIYYFGGYGLFTFKNILTKFDFKTKEWELVKYKNNNRIPEPRTNALLFIKKEKLYLIGGLTDDFETNLTTTINKRLNDIWELNLKTKEWNYLGDLKDEKSINYLYFQDVINEKLVFDYGKLYEFDFDNNSLNFTEPKDKYTFSRFERFNPITNEIFYILETSDESNRKLEIIIEDYNIYTSEFVNSKTLIKSNIFYYSVAFLVFTIVLILIYYFKRKRKESFENKIYLKNSLFYFKDKLIHNLSSDENDLLLFFFKQKENPTPMNEVVDFFSKKDNTTYNTLTKKKDLVLNGLKQKLAFILEVNEDELFISQKNTEDKRIKEIQLNPKCFLF